MDARGRGPRMAWSLVVGLIVPEVKDTEVTEVISPASCVGVRMRQEILQNCHKVRAHTDSDTGNVRASMPKVHWRSG